MTQPVTQRPRNGFYANHTFPSPRHWHGRRPLGDRLLDVAVATIVCSGVVASVILGLALILGSVWLALWVVRQLAGLFT